MVKVEAQENAVNMLRTQATHLGTVGTIEYYVLDGKAWTISSGVAYRSDDQEESDRLRERVQDVLKRRKAREESPVWQARRNSGE